MSSWGVGGPFSGVQWGELSHLDISGKSTKSNFPREIGFTWKSLKVLLETEVFRFIFYYSRIPHFLLNRYDCILVQKSCSRSWMFWQFENESYVFTLKLWKSVGMQWKYISSYIPFLCLSFQPSSPSSVFVSSDVQILILWDWLPSHVRIRACINKNVSALIGLTLPNESQ